MQQDGNDAVSVAPTTPTTAAAVAAGGRARAESGDKNLMDADAQDAHDMYVVSFDRI
jgi:hypothetical protein